ncbi:hypothetical protein ACH4VR_36220 [Streptomyces sp. NPDC020883]|uniref:hypothetical protein n=1 Tax=Streptomyces sp. NPDC020883 TaxID=3365099 RepID=UPI0037A1949D
MKSRRLRNAVVTTLSAGLLTTGVMAVASPASAAASDSCPIHAVMDHGNIQGATWARTTNVTTLNTAPYDWARTVDALPTGVTFWATCSTMHWRWVKVELTSPGYRGETGWIDRWDTSLY